MKNSQGLQLKFESAQGTNRFFKHEMFGRVIFKIVQVHSFSSWYSLQAVLINLPDSKIEHLIYLWNSFEKIIYPLNCKC